MKQISLFVFFWLGALLLYAQKTKTDLIYRTNNTTITGTVIEVTDAIVKYRNTNDPTIYRLSTQDIVKIVYANGEVENYSKINPATTNTQSASLVDAYPYKHTAWVSLGVGGSSISSIPITFGYSYQLLPRMAIVGSFQKALFPKIDNTWVDKYSSVGVGMRLYSKPENLIGSKLRPFIEFGVGLIIDKSSYIPNTLTFFANTYTDIFPVPGFAVGALFNPHPQHGLYGKMNLGPLSITPLSLIDFGYTFRF